MPHKIKNTVIRDTLLGNRLIEVPRRIRNVIDAPEFQRLRSIRQTGLTSFVFPSAEHSRFAHSIGVYGTACRFFAHLKRCAMDLNIKFESLCFDDVNAADFTIAALVHDVGHTAFSHVLESNLLPEGFASHEDCTLALLSESTEIAKIIHREADRAAVYQMLDHRHPNRTLNDLVSSSFDVDRCDYILRDSALTGVEYGKYDISWLIHSLSVDKNSNGQPVLVLDGPRGVDALKQFFSGRRYLYRQVYYHAAVRGAQLLLKAIFERIQHTLGHKNHLDLAPRCLHSIMNGKKPSLGDFLRTTDTEILYMIREFADLHKDPVLRQLSQWFCERHFPKAILNTAKLSGDLDAEYRIEPRSSEHEERQQLLPLYPSYRTIRRDQFEGEIRAVTAKLLEQAELPKEIADYLVIWDAPPLPSTPAPNLLLTYGRKTVSFDDISETESGRDFQRLLSSFTIERFYVPRRVADALEKHVFNHYHLESDELEQRP